MRFELQHRPAYALAIVHLEGSETVVAEAGAMVSMSDNVTIETSAGGKGDGLMGSLMKGLKRMVAGESFFQNRFTANNGAGEVTFAPALQGDIETTELDGGTLYLQSTAYICSAESIEVTAKWGGARTFFGGEGLVMLKATGTGPIAFNCFGAIKAVDIDGTFIVDTGHIVAFEESVQFKVSRFGGGWKSFIFGGEGLVCTFSGKGRVWIQTRNPNSFGQLLGQQLPPRQG